MDMGTLPRKFDLGGGSAGYPHRHLLTLYQSGENKIPPLSELGIRLNSMHIPWKRTYSRNTSAFCGKPEEDAVIPQPVYVSRWVISWLIEVFTWETTRKIK